MTLTNRSLKLIGLYKLDGYKFNSDEEVDEMVNIIVEARIKHRLLEYKKKT